MFSPRLAVVGVISVKSVNIRTFTTSKQAVRNLIRHKTTHLLYIIMGFVHMDVASLLKGGRQIELSQPFLLQKDQGHKVRSLL